MGSRRLGSFDNSNLSRKKSKIRIFTWAMSTCGSHSQDLTEAPRLPKVRDNRAKAQCDTTKPGGSFAIYGMSA